MQIAIDDGSEFTTCRKRFGIAHATWMKAIRRGDLRVKQSHQPFSDARRRYDWSQIQLFYDEGHSIRACRAAFGFSLHAWEKARAAGKIRSRPVPRMTIAQLLESIPTAELSSAACSPPVN